MKTKGLNKKEDLDETSFEYGSQEDREVKMKKMMNSCFAYGSISKSSYAYRRYIFPYKEQLPDEVFEEVYNEHKEFLSQCKIERMVYTDCEGCSYNSIIEPE